MRCFTVVSDFIASINNKYQKVNLYSIPKWILTKSSKMFEILNLLNKQFVSITNFAISIIVRWKEICNKKKYVSNQSCG